MHGLSGGELPGDEFGVVGGGDVREGMTVRGGGLLLCEVTSGGDAVAALGWGGGVRVGGTVGGLAWWLRGIICCPGECLFAFVDGV
jgi:hypothetical protein